MLLLISFLLAQISRWRRLDLAEILWAG